MEAAELAKHRQEYLDEMKRFFNEATVYYAVMS